MKAGALEIGPLLKYPQIGGFLWMNVKSLFY